MSYVHCPKCSRAFNLVRTQTCPECASAPLASFALVPPPPPALDPIDAIVAAAKALARAIEIATPAQLAAARARFAVERPAAPAALPPPPMAVPRRMSLRESARIAVRQVRAIAVTIHALVS